MDNKQKLVTAGIVGSISMILASRVIPHQVTKLIGSVFMTDSYDENLLELFSAAKRVGPQVIAETNLRAEEGLTIARPLGTPVTFIHLDGLAFNPAILHKLPTPANESIDTTTVLGKHCQKPMILQNPILIAGMAYGFALSEEAKYALAKGSAYGGTATNTGEGAFLQKERELAKHLVIQYNRGHWSKEPEILRQADMIEIQLGQGAYVGTGHSTKSSLIDPLQRKRLKLPPGKPAIIEARLPELTKKNGLRNLVIRLRELTGGVPIACKFPFTNDLEKDIDIALEAQIDVLALEGGQAATKGSPPILEDDFGLPTIIGLSRTLEHLEKHRVRDKVDIIVSGGLNTPGHFLKVLALGADAVYIGAIAMFAMTHTQVLKGVPFEPPTQVIWNDGKYKNTFNWKQGGTSLGKFLTSCREEMCEGVRALGKRALSELARSDLCSLDQKTADITKIPMAYQPITHTQQATPIRRRRVRSPLIQRP